MPAKPRSPSALDPRTETMVLEHRGHAFAVSYLFRPGQGETLLYLHGLGGSKEDFLGAWSVAEWRNYSLLALDAPACGATGGYQPGLPLGVDDIVQTAEALVAHYGLSGMTVIGHSMGGLAALLFTLRNRPRVRRLVSVEGNLGPEDCSLYSRSAYQHADPSTQGAFLDSLLERMRASGAAGFAEAADVLRDNVEEQAFFDYCRSLVRYCDEACPPLLEEFLALDLPSIYVHGSANEGLWHLRRLGEAGVPVASIPASDHFPMHTNPHRFYEALVGFVAETGRQEGSTAFDRGAPEGAEE